MAARRRSRSGAHKKISGAGVAGQKGVNLIERVVLDMESRWTPSGPNEIGIDGYIEMFDPRTRKPLGLTLAVQSKVVSSAGNDGSPTFGYRCDPRDVEYWLAGNMPVILVVSAPSASAAWWISIKDYFKDWTPGSSTKITFAKTSHRFTKDSFDALLGLAAPTGGLFLAPPRKSEQLHSNLLRVEAFPNRIHIADTDCRWPSDVWALLRTSGQDPDAGWVLKGRRFISFHDISRDPWTTVCDAGTVETFPTSDWSDSSAPERQQLFVQLLNQTLRAQLHDEVRYWPKEDCFAITGRPRQLSYQSLKRRSKISVVSGFSRTATDGRVFQWRRHLAFRSQFRLFGGQWCLEITPTYRFTRDGYEIDRFHRARLKGIKQLEGNRAVLSSVLFWAHYLQPKTDLFSVGPPPIRFGKLVTFDLPVGIDDAQWLSDDPDYDESAESPTTPPTLPHIDDLFS